MSQPVAPILSPLMLPVAAILIACAGAVAQSVPELIYYKFNEPSGTTTVNSAVPGAGSNPATVNNQILGQPGQFGNGLTGVGGVSSTNFVDTGWITALGTGSWTLGFWLDNRATGSGAATQYMCGDATALSFRVFSGGVAGGDNLILRGTGITDVILPGGASASVVTAVAWVYDATVPEIRAYRDGALVATVAQPALSINGSANFKVGGYSTSGALFVNGHIDEFRLYNRALGAPEIAATWNIELGGPMCTLTSPMPAATVGGTVSVTSDITHTGGQPVDATYEYSLDGGMTWMLATAGGASVNPTTGIATPAVGATFDWDTQADMIGLLAPVPADLRVTVTDAAMLTSNCTVTALLVDNVPPPPTCTLAQTTPGTAGGSESFDLNPDSVSAGTVDATFEYSLDGGMSWLMATADGASSNPLLGATIMSVNVFLWDSRADAVGLAVPVVGVLLRATVTDGTPVTGSCVTPAFDVDNTALCQTVCGDCDDDSFGPNIIDSLTAAQIAAGLIAPTMRQQGCCDANASMSITILDALSIAQVAAGLPAVLTCL